MRITMIGSGNVATHMAAAFKNAGHQLVQVYSRSLQHASLLACHVKAEAIDDLAQINPETDLFLIAVKDDAIAGIARRLAIFNKLIIHTSGATSLQVLLEITTNAGVLYPLQTFSKNKEVNFSSVPLCIEGADAAIGQVLATLGQTISHNIHQVDSARRKVLHLAAVFACNFPNYLYYAAQSILAEHQLDFNLLRPLISETAEKVQQQLPVQVQTGPAVRHDEGTMEAHLQLLQGHSDLQQIYRILSQAIIKMK